MKWSVCYSVLAVWCISFCAQAQYTSRLGRFQVDEVKGCASLTVTITINPPAQCNGANPCDMDFGDTSAAQNVFTHTYSQPGTYLLRILFQTSGFDDIQIVVAPNTQPQFDLYTCSNNEVSVTVTDTNYNQYVINYNDGSPDVIVPVGAGAKNNHVYATAGVKNVTVRGRNLSADDNCNPATKSITALTTLPVPALTQLQVVNSTTIQLDFSAQQNILYRLEIATNTASSFQLYKTLYNVTTETVVNLRPDDNYYCFRLGAFDPCNNTTAYSNTICSSNFDLNIQNNANILTWATSAAGVSNFRLTRTTQGSSLTTTVTGSSYSDTGLVCGTDYCYQLVTNYPNGSSSVSLQKCGTAISTNIPSAVENITASATQNGADIQWQQVVNFTPAEFTIFKSVNAQYSLFTQTTNLQVSDPEYVTENESCYQISYKDVCDNQSPRSIEACPIRLIGNLQKNNSISLSWTTYSGWRDGVSNYIVEKYSEQGALIQTFNAGTSTTLLDDTQDLNNQTYFYVVKANAVEAGLPQASSNRIMVIKNPNLFYPTAFTPNGDNLNDIFNVYGQFISDFEMHIFNRWGELMYTTTVLDQGWDGNYRGNPMPEGTYAFVADIKDLAGRSFKKSGSLVLLRKSN